MQRFRQLRIEKGLTLNKISEALGISYESYRKYEIGEREPGFDMLIRIADYFDVTTDYLLGRSKNKFNIGEKLSSKQSLILHDFNKLIPAMQDLLIIMAENLTDK